MAHGRRAGTVSDIAAPGPSLRLGPSAQSEADQRRLAGEASERTLVNGGNDLLSPPVPAQQSYTSRGPNPEVTEDTGSEYDNVGSDVEQDCEEVLHLNREAVVEARFCKQVADSTNEMGRAADRHAPTSPRCTETFRGFQSGAKPHKASHSCRAYCAPPGTDAAQGGVEKGHENRLLLSDGDEIEEVLDGARFIEDLDDAGSSVPPQTPLCHDNEKGRMRKRGDDTRATRKKNVPGGCKKRELSHVDSKERQGKGRGRRGPGEDMERASTTCSADPPPKSSSKDSKKGSVRSKARSSRQHPAPPPRRPPSPAQHRRETPPVPEATASSAASPDGQARLVKPFPAQREDAHTRPEDSQQVATQQSRALSHTSPE